MGERWVTAEEVRERLGVDQDQLYTMLLLGRVTSRRKATRVGLVSVVRTEYLLESVERALALDVELRLRRQG